MSKLQPSTKTMNASKLLFFATAVTVALVSRTTAADIPGGWLDRKWNLESTNDIPRFAMPSDLIGPDLATARPAAVKAKSAAAAASSLAVAFTSGGLAGALPAADDSRMRELARGLDHDWERCFEFVRNHIAYAPYPGIVKGPERTLLDRKGNAADQSFLLCALLRASGYDTATVLYLPLDPSSADSGLIIPLHNNDGTHPYCAATWLDASNNALLWVRLSPNGLSFNQIDNTHIAIEHYWVRVEIDGVQVHLDPSIKPQPGTITKDAKTASGYDRDAFLTAAGGTVDANSVQNLSESGIANYLTERVADLKAAWNAPGASPDSVLGTQTVTPYAEGDPRFHGAWSSKIEPIDLLAAPAETVNALRAKVTLDNHGYDFQTPPGEPDWTTEFSFYLDEVGSRTLWFAKDGNGDLGFFVDEDQVSQSALWDYFGSASVGVKVAYADYPSYHSYTMLPADGHVHVLAVNLGDASSDGMGKAATKRISNLRARGLSDTDNIMRAALLQLQGQQWLSQANRYVRLWSRIMDYDKGSFYNIGIAGKTEGPFVDMANSFLKGYGESGIIDSYAFFRSALEHSVIEQLNGVERQAISTAKILSLANAGGNPIYYMTSNNVSAVTSALSGYSTSQKNAFVSSTANGDIYLLPKNATVSLNEWTGTGYVQYGENSNGNAHTGMIIQGGMNGGFCTEAYDPESGQTIIYCWVLDEHQDAAGGDEKHADPVSMPAGAYLDSEIDLAVSRAVPLAWTRSYDTRSASSDGDLGRGWSHGFEASVFESSDADAALGGTSLDAVLPAVVATVAAEDLVTGTSGLTAGEIARRLTATALVADWWTKQLPQTCISVKIGAKSLSFQKMPDGSYAPAPGVAATLAHDANGLYTLKERHGNTYAFNADKKLASVTDPSGNVTTLVYADGKLARVVNSFGASMTITRDAAGRIASVTDNSGKSVSYVYDANGCMTAATDAAGEVWTYAYDSASNRMVSKKNPNGDFLIRNTYNGYGQVTNQISSNGEAWRFGYAADVEGWNVDPKNGRLTQTFDADCRDLSRTGRDGATSTTVYDGHGHVSVATDALGNRRTFTYDTRDNLLSSTEGSGTLARTTRFGYDAQDRLVAVTNTLGHATTYEYDACDRVVRVTAPDATYTVNDWNANGTLATTHAHDASGNELRRTTLSYGDYGLPVSRTLTGIGLPAAGITTRTEYNADGSVAATTDALGNRTAFAYDAAGRLVSTTDALGNVSTIEYDRAGNVVAARDALGRVTRTTHTVSGLPLQTTLPDGNVMRTEYDSVEDVSASTDVRGARRTIERDAEGRPLSATDALGNSDAVIYDALGRPVWAQDASGVESWTDYDALSRPVANTDAFGATWTTDYDKLDRAVSSTTPLGRTSRVAYDNVGQLVATTRPSGAVDSFGYDAMGNQTSYTNAEGHVYGTAYDALGRVVASTNALGVQVAAMSYDANGNLVRAEDGNGAVHTYAYDALDRLVSRTSPDGTDTFAYDAVGNVVSAANGTAAETFAYDAMDRLVAATTEISGLTFRNEWRRDAGGFVTNLVYAPGKVVAKTFDIEGRLVAVRDWLGHEWDFDWDAAGRLASLSSPDGRTRTQTYDAAGRLAAWRVGDLVGRSLEYDLAGRKTCDNVTAGAMPAPAEVRHAENTFDAADRLVSSSVELGDGTTRAETFSYNRNDAMVEAVAGGASVAFRYDADGALAGLTADGTEATFGYDAFGNRVLAGGHIWIPDQSDSLKRPLLECDAAGNLVRAYVWAGGMLLGYVDADGALTVAHTDELGGIVALSRTDSAILHTAQYGPHGEDWGRTGTNPTPFAWLGGFGVQRLPQDTFLGDLYLTRHRLYAPAQQRFLSSDPLGFAGGLNLYAYGNGNSLAYIDPLGLCGESVGARGTQGNPYEIGERPPSNVYHKGDWIKLSDGSLYQLQEDSYMDFSMTWDSLKMYLQRKRPISVILYDVDPQSYIDYRYSDADANNRIIYNNMQQANSTIGSVYQAATSSAPSPSTLPGQVISKVVNVGFAANDANNLKNKILPTIPESKTKGNPVQSNSEAKQKNFIERGVSSHARNKNRAFQQRTLDAKRAAQYHAGTGPNIFAIPTIPNEESSALSNEIQVQKSADNIVITIDIMDCDWIMEWILKYK